MSTAVATVSPSFEAVLPNAKDFTSHGWSEVQTFKTLLKKSFGIDDDTAQQIYEEIERNQQEVLSEVTDYLVSKAEIRGNEALVDVLPAGLVDAVIEKYKPKPEPITLEAAVDKVNAALPSQSKFVLKSPAVGEAYYNGLVQEIKAGTGSHRSSDLRLVFPDVTELEQAEEEISLEAAIARINKELPANVQKILAVREVVSGDLFVANRGGETLESNSHAYGVRIILDPASGR